MLFRQTLKRVVVIGISRFARDFRKAVFAGEGTLLPLCSPGSPVTVYSDSKVDVSRGGVEQAFMLAVKRLENTGFSHCGKNSRDTPTLECHSFYCPVLNRPPDGRSASACSQVPI